MSQQEVVPSKDTIVICNVAAVTHELRVMVPVAFSIATTAFSRLCMFTVDAAFIGHVSKDSLGAATLAGCLMLAFQPVGGGFALGINPLCAQARGADNPRLCGVWIQYAVASILLITSVTTPVSIIVTAPILRRLSVQPSMVADAHRFALIANLRLSTATLFQMFRTFLFSQGETRVPVILAVLTFLLNALLNYFFVIVASMGFIGAPIATLTTSIIQFVWMLSYTIVSGKLHAVWTPISLRSFTWTRTKEVLKIALGIAASNTMLFAVYLAAVLLTGPMGPEVSDRQGIFDNFRLVMLSMVMGWGIALQKSLSGHLGAGRPDLARISGLAGIVGTLCTSSIMALLAGVFCRGFASIFTPDPSMHDGVCREFPVVGVSCTLVNTAMATQHALDGCGKANRSAMSCFVGIVVFGCSSYLLYGQGLVGIWYSVGLYGATWAGLCTLFLVRGDWGSFSAAAVRRSRPLQGEVKKVVVDGESDDTSA